MGQTESSTEGSMGPATTMEPNCHDPTRQSFASPAPQGSQAEGSDEPQRKRTDTGSSEEGKDGDSGDPEDRIFEMSVSEIMERNVKDDFRLQYLRKISQQKVWVPREQRPPKHQTVVIFDWDDTLLCTSFLNLRQDQALSPVVERHLRGIEAADKKLLEMAMKLGHTFIITNAMSGWVEYSATKYVPGLLPVLQQIPIISARSKYEGCYPGEVAKWKVSAFLEVQKQLDSQVITNLISLGDSNFEMDAVHVMGKEFAQALVKTIKFRESPSPEELLKQLELVGQKFERIVENARNLKIGLERKWVGGDKQGQPQQAPGQQTTAPAAPANEN